ncbi:MAG: hypothetical protein ACPL3P_05920 [Anaerolineales bacterium]
MKKLTMHSTLVFTIFAFILFSLFLASCQSNSTTPASTTNPPSSAQGNNSASSGAALLQERCTVCHSLDRITNEKNSRAQWERIVDRMIQKGAQLNDSEKATLLDYLAQNYGQ